MNKNLTFALALVIGALLVIMVEGVAILYLRSEPYDEGVT